MWKSVFTLFAQIGIVEPRVELAEIREPEFGAHAISLFAELHVDFTSHILFGRHAGKLYIHKIRHADRGFNHFAFAKNRSMTCWDSPDSNACL